jgi:pyruvate/2-oxoglutarate dehydrogenase complex dihydrolipoamide acyltransferase (E2) component
MRLPLALAAIVALSACAGGAPYSNVLDTAGGGVGFSDYAQYMRAQEELSRIRRAEAAARAEQPQRLGPDGQPMRAAPHAGFQPQGFGAAQTQVPAQSQTAAQAPVGQPVATTALAQPQAQAAPRQQAAASGFDTGTPAQAFDPAGQAAQTEEGVSVQSYEAQPFGTPIQNRVVRRDHVPQVRVTADEAPAASGPNLFNYALSTRHAVGEERYTRRNPFRWRRWEAACARYPHQDLAQEAFLAAGGPERDPEHMDPDGDGYACWWDPAPFRQAATTVRARQ